MSGGAWSNWSGSVSAAPRLMAWPETDEEIATFVRSGPAPVRVAGSGHSFTPLCASDGSLLSLDRHEGVVRTDAQAGLARVKAGTKLFALGKPLAEAGLALMNMGDIDRQALAGALQTGTHGTGEGLGALADEVRAMRLVLADGSVTECDPSANAELYQAARVGLGMFGVLSEVTLNCAPAYALRERTAAAPAAEVLRDFDRIASESRHAEFFWFPHTELMILKRLDRHLGPLPEKKPLSPAVKWMGQAERALMRAFSRLAGHVPQATPYLQRMLMALVSPVERTGLSYRIFPSARDVRFNEMEVAVPRAQGLACLQEIASYARQQTPDVFFPIEYRTVKADQIWLSPFYGRDSATIAIHHYAPFDPVPFFKGAWEIFRRYDGRPHWGKMHFLTRAELDRLYPMADEARAARHQADPDGRFLNPHLAPLFGR